jgi:hypothetical protein
MPFGGEGKAAAHTPLVSFPITTQSMRRTTRTLIAMAHCAVSRESMKQGNAESKGASRNRPQERFFSTDPEAAAVLEERDYADLLDRVASH